MPIEMRPKEVEERLNVIINSLKASSSNCIAIDGEYLMAIQKAMSYAHEIASGERPKVVHCTQCEHQRIKNAYTGDCEVHGGTINSYGFCSEGKKIGA